MLSATRIDGGGGGRGQPPGSLPLTPAQQQQLPGGRFDFDDGGMYCGGWEEGKATGHGICTGPRNQGEYAGSWHLGFELSGCYTWPSGNTYSGGWQNGKRHGLGVETRGRWIYRGEWNQGLKGRYGTRCSLTSGARYEGTFSNGLQDGYGTETYADGGLFQGQWQRGLRHGYGVRSSAPFAAASVQRKKSLHSQPSVGVEPEATIAEEEQEDPAAERDHKIDQNRGGFVLKAHSEEPTVEKKRKTMAERKDAVKSTILRGLRLKKQYSTGDIDQKSGNHMASGSSMRSARSNSSFGSSGAESGGMASAASETNISFISQEEILEPNVTENYTGEWKNDKRSGYGVAERSDGLKYEGEWHNNRKYGYGVTSFRDGTREEGKYKNNILVSSQKKKATFLVRASRIREKIDQAVQAAQRASQIALQKADISMNRTATARGKAEQAEIASMNAKEDAEIAKAYASQFAPDNRGERPAAQYTNTAFNNHITDSAAQQRAQSLYGNPQHQTQNHNANQMSNRLPNPNIHVQAAYMEDDPSGPTGIAARIGGRLTVDDSHVQDLNNGSRRTSFNNQQPPQQGQQHLGDAGFEDYAPEQFLNRSSPRNLSVRNSVRSRRSVNYANNPNNSSNQHGNNANQYGNGANQYVNSANNANPYGNNANNFASTSQPINQQRRPGDIGTTSVMTKTVISNDPSQTTAYSNGPIPRVGGLPVPEMRYTDSGSPYYVSTPDPALMTPFLNQNHHHLAGTPEYMQQVADRLQSQNSPRGGMVHQSSLFVGDSSNYQLYRPTPAPQPSGNRRSTLPVLTTDPIIPPKPPRTPQLLGAIQESSTNSSMSKGLQHQHSSPAPSDSTTSKMSGSGLVRQPSQETSSSVSRPTLGMPGGGGGLGRTPGLAKIPKFGSINMGASRGSMPDIFAAVTEESPLSREEVSRLSQERREAVRRRKEEEERMRKNPLLLIFHPALREFFSRHRLTLAVAVINITLIYLFSDLLYSR